MTTTFPKKDPGEKFWISFDYTNELDAGETIISTVISNETIGGVDASPAGMLSGSATIQPGAVLQIIMDGKAGCTYAPKCLATTSAGRILARAAELPVAYAKDW